MLHFKLTKRGVLVVISVLLLSHNFTESAYAADCGGYTRQLAQYRTITVEIVNDLIRDMKCRPIRSEIFCPLWNQLQTNDMALLDYIVDSKTVCSVPESQIRLLKAAIIKGDAFAKHYCQF